MNKWKAFVLIEVFFPHFPCRRWIFNQYFQKKIVKTECSLEDDIVRVSTDVFKNITIKFFPSRAFI